MSAIWGNTETAQAYPDKKIPVVGPLTKKNNAFRETDEELFVGLTLDIIVNRYSKK